ncbi:TPA: hypothetical protein LAN19_004212 [Escherichia coli]|nr:hypothetical protein [Escherichia coli]
MTLGALLALCKSFSMQKSTVLCAIAAKRVKKQQTEKKDQKNTCAKNWDPYNAPPLRRQRETPSQDGRNNEEKKILKFRVDSERGKRNIRHLATVS